MQFATSSERGTDIRAKVELGTGVGTVDLVADVD